MSALPPPPQLYELFDGAQFLQGNVVAWAAVEGAWFITSSDGRIGAYPFKHYKNLNLTPKE